MAERKRKSSKRKPAAKCARKVTIAKGVKVKWGKEKQLAKKPGASNVGEYKTVGKKKFCGSTPGTFPVNTAKRCRAALAYAHNDPHPEKVRACVKRKCKGKVKEFSKKR